MKQLITKFWAEAKFKPYWNRTESGCR